jgi:hypothetical protein
MESKKINQLATELAPDLSDLTIIGDPTTGISKKITLSQMASLFTGTVEEYANFAAFPLVGVADTIYIALDTNVLYRWNTGTSAYVELSPNIINSLVFSDANGFDGNISLVGSVATLTITTALTTGSVPFIGASGALSQDNANLFFDDTNNRLGINTNAPTTALDIFGSGIIGRINGTSTNNAYLGFASAGTNKWSVGNVQSDHRFRIFSEANSAELITILQTGEFGIGIANPTTKFHIDGAASALIANLDANVSVAKSVSFRSDNSNRINLEVSGTESGSNAGADFFLRTYTDAGSLLATPLTITRSTSAITLTGALSSTFVGQFLGNTGASTSSKIIRISNTSADMAIGVEGSTATEIIAASGGIAYSSIFKTVGTTSLILGTNSVAALTINGSTQAATFSNSATAISFIPTGSTIPSNGMYLSAANTLNFATNATNRLSISSTGSAIFASSVNAAQGIFSSDFTQNETSKVGISFASGYGQINSWGANASTYGGLKFQLSVSNGATVNALTLAPSGAATFSSTIASTGASFSGDINLSGGAEINHTGRLVFDAGAGNGFLFRTNNVGATAIEIESSGIVNVGGWGTGTDISLRIKGNAAGQVGFFNHNGQLYMPFLDTSTGTDLVLTSGGFINKKSSSIRYKENIETIDIGLDFIMSLNPVKFNIKSDGLAQVGFVAEEFPDERLVTFSQVDIEDTSKGLQKESINYAQITAPLVKAIQEQQQQIEELKAKIK